MIVTAATKDRWGSIKGHGRERPLRESGLRKCWRCIVKMMVAAVGDLRVRMAGPGTTALFIARTKSFTP